ncbi:MAG: Omp28-related outer membrane protein [Paludibacteraceae bacterium]|nr:Omp28-related outer membrane protein [Paludibacteraceae bacterium]
MKIKLIILLLLAGVKMSAETPTFFPRKFLLEHFTSANCNQCPMGMKYIVEYLEKQTTPYIWVSHHAVYGTDEYTIPASNAIAMNYLGMNSVPSVVFNRSKQDGLLVIGAWNIENLVVKDDTLAEASVVIDHQFDAATRRLNITVSGQVANIDRKEYLLTILIKENRLVGKQEDAYCSWKGAKWQEYMHPRVVRDLVTATLGDTVKVENLAYHYSTSYILDKEWVAENCCVVAYLTPLEKSPIINAEQAPLVVGTEGGEQYGPYGITEGKGPNTSISFDSVRVTQLGNGQLEMMLTSSKTIKTSYFGICKQVGYVYVNTTDSVLQPGVYPISDTQYPISAPEGTITAGYRVDEEERLGGSRLLYAVSADLKNGIITPIHQWRMSSGEMTIDANGNILLNFTTYNGTSVTATAVYDFSPAATGVEDVEGLRSSEVQKVLRDGQLLIEHKGQWYSVLGYRL